MNEEETKQQSPTDVLIKALEEAGDMDDVIVIYVIKPDSSGNSYLGWNSTITKTREKIGILEETKINIVRAAFSKRDT